MSALELGGDSLSDIMEQGNSQNNDVEMENEEGTSTGKKSLICADIAYNLVQFLTRQQLGQYFSLVSYNFHALSYAKMHKVNPHWVNGDDHWLVVRLPPAKSVFLIKRNNYHEIAQLPDVRRPQNMLGIRGIINFNGLLTDQVVDFIHHALEPAKSVLNLPHMTDFYKVNGLSMGRRFPRFNRLLRSVLHVVTDTQNGELFKWLMKSDGKWRELVLTERVNNIATKDAWIKQIVQDFVHATNRCNFNFTFNSYYSVAESCLKNPVTNEILHIRTISPEYYMHKIYMVRCPVEMRGNLSTVGQLRSAFSWGNHPCKLVMKAEEGIATSI